MREDIRSYSLITASYWSFTLTDGALRMLVLLHFHELGYNPLNIALLFLLYELFGIITNLFGGWIASRLGLKVTLFAGLATQAVALILLSFMQEGWLPWVSMAYVMMAQALSGIAKDLTKMSAKSAVKLVVSDGPGRDSRGVLFTWVALLTGSKNALKGAGFFLGGFLLSTLGFRMALWAMAGALVLVLIVSVLNIRQDLGRSKERVAFTGLFSKNRNINVLSAARCLLFGSRDVWFVVALPLFLTDELGWSFSGVGGFLAVWVIGYGAVQAAVPRMLRQTVSAQREARAVKDWGFALVAVSAAMAVSLQTEFHATVAVLAGLAVFGVVFAINSAVHSDLILAYSDADTVTLNVGFYYMANAAGRLLGTLLSGGIYLVGGLTGCLWASTLCVLGSAMLTVLLSEPPATPGVIATEYK